MTFSNLKWYFHLKLSSSHTGILSVGCRDWMSGNCRFIICWTGFMMSEQSSLLLIILFLCSSVKLPTQNVELASVSGIFLFLAGRHVSSCCKVGVSNLNFFLFLCVFLRSVVRFRGVEFQLFLWFRRVWFCVLFLNGIWSRMDSCVYVFSTRLFPSRFLVTPFKLLFERDLKLTSRLSASTGRPTFIRTARMW